jgi:hypothetical protein
MTPPNARLEFRHDPGLSSLRVRVVETVGGCPPALFKYRVYPNVPPIYVGVCTAADLSLPVGPLGGDVPPGTCFRLGEAAVPGVPAPAVEEAAGRVRMAVASLCRAIRPAAGGAASWAVWADPDRD